MNNETFCGFEPGSLVFVQAKYRMPWYKRLWLRLLGKLGKRIEWDVTYEFETRKSPTGTGLIGQTGNQPGGTIKSMAMSLSGKQQRTSADDRMDRIVAFIAGAIASLFVCWLTR